MGRSMYRIDFFQKYDLHCPYIALYNVRPLYSLCKYVCTNIYFKKLFRIFFILVTFPICKALWSNMNKGFQNQCESYSNLCDLKTLPKRIVSQVVYECA